MLSCCYQKSALSCSFQWLLQAISHMWANLNKCKLAVSIDSSCNYEFRLRLKILAVAVV